MNQYYTEKQQTQYVDDTMRKARVQARKAQQTGGVIPSVKGIRESVSQPTVSAAPSTPSTPSVQTTPSVPTVRPPSVTSPALTTPNAAADVPLATPKPTAEKTHTANVQRANSDILNANKQKATTDVWGTDPAPAASPLQTATPAKAAAVKIKQTDYTKPDAGGILKPQAPAADVPVSTAPVSNRTALFGAKDTPDLTLTAKKLEQMGDLYREFSPQQRALLDDYYKDDPASLNVIRGRTTGNDWLLAQSRAAQQREQARAAVAAQRRAQAARQLALDPTVQADARRSGELLHTPGAPKAVTESTQPAYSTEEVAQRKEEKFQDTCNNLDERSAQSLGEIVKICQQKYGRDSATVSGSINQTVGYITDSVKTFLREIFPEEFYKGVLEDLNSFDIANQSERAVLDANYFSAYKGHLVVKIPDSRHSFSYGIIGLGKIGTNADFVRHEYGHTVQLDEFGPIGYLFAVAIPSVINNYLTNAGVVSASYYDAPWEAPADRYGGVVRDESEPWSQEWYDSYDIYCQKVVPVIETFIKNVMQSLV